jgi:hypothetical protein
MDVLRTCGRERPSCDGKRMTEDAVDGPLHPTCTPLPGSLFRIGITNVTCTATDKAGNTANNLFTITVHDSTLPSSTEHFISVNTNKNHYLSGEFIQVSGKVYDAKGKPLSEKVGIRVSNIRTSNIVYQTSFLSINGFYSPSRINIVQPGTYLVNASLGNSKEASWTTFEIEENPAYSPTSIALYVLIPLFVILLITFLLWKGA